MKTSSTFSNAAAAAAAAPQLVRSDLVGVRRFERSAPRDFDRSIGDEISPKIRRRLPVLDARGRHGGIGIAKHVKATDRIRPSETTDPRNDDEGRRRSANRAKLRPSSTEADRARLLERQHTVVLSRNGNLLVCGRDNIGSEEISGQRPAGVYRCPFDGADLLPIPQQEGDAYAAAAAVSSIPGVPRRARPQPSSASLTTTAGQQSRPKMLLGTSSDKTVYQRQKEKRGTRTRDEKRKSRARRRETRTIRHHTVVSAPYSSEFGPQQRNGAEGLDPMAFDVEALVGGGFDATLQTSSIRELPGFPSRSQGKQDQNLLGRGSTRCRVQDRWNSFISANLDADAVDAAYRFENTDKDDAVKGRGTYGFAEMQSVHEEQYASDSPSLVSDREDRRQDDDGDDNGSESTDAGAYLRGSGRDDPSLFSAARLMRKNTFSDGLNELFDGRTIETDSAIRSHAQGGGSGCRRIAPFKFLTPRTEGKKKKQAENMVTPGGMSSFRLHRSFSDGAVTYPEATPGDKRPPHDFVSSPAANTSDSGETVTNNSSCASKTELIHCSNHHSPPALIPYESVHVSYAEPLFATATVLDPSHPTAGYANVFELKVPILYPKLRRSADTVENYIAEFSEDARLQNNSLPDGRRFDTIRDPLPAYLASGPIVLGFQMKERDAGPHVFRDSFGRNFLADRCLAEDRSMQKSATEAFCRIPRTENPSTAMQPPAALLSRRPPPSNDVHAQSPRSLHPQRFIPTYANQQQTELDVAWKMDGYPRTAENDNDDDNDDDDYWQSDYTDPCLCLHGDLMRGSVEEWEASDARAVNGRLRRRSRTQRRLKTEKRNPGRSTFTRVKPLEDPRLVEEIFMHADSNPQPNTQAAAPLLPSSYPVAANSPRLQSNREIVPLTEGSRLSGVDIGPARSIQGGDFDGIRMRCPGIEIVTSEDERRFAINRQRTTGNATDHSGASTRNCEGAGHAQTPRGERTAAAAAAAGESGNCACTQTPTGAEDHGRKLEKRMRTLGIQQAFCLMLVIGAYIFLSIIYFKQ